VKKFSDDFELVVLINEVFDTQFDRLTWHAVDLPGTVARITGEAWLGAGEYRLYLEPRNVELAGQTITYLNVSFVARGDGGEFTERLLSNTKNASKVLGAVSNAFRDKVLQLDAEYELDALVFGVVTAEPRRLAVYDQLVKSKLYGLTATWHTYKENVPLQNGIAIVAFKRSLSAAALRAFEHHLQDQQKVIE